MSRAFRSRRRSWINHFRWRSTTTATATGGLLARWQRTRAARLLERPLDLWRRASVPGRASSLRPGQDSTRPTSRTGRG
eukprot:2812000-Alexandrium_andersonii.AAC.1